MKKKRPTHTKKENKTTDTRQKLDTIWKINDNNF